MIPDFVERDTGLVPVEMLLTSDAGLAERGVEFARLKEVVVGESGVKVGAIAPNIRPAAKTQPPTACRMRESPVKLPVMNTF